MKRLKPLFSVGGEVTSGLWRSIVKLNDNVFGMPWMRQILGGKKRFLLPIRKKGIYNNHVVRFVLIS